MAVTDGRTPTTRAPRDEDRPLREQARYSVYVIELEQRLCIGSGCFSRNGRRPVYVGQSAVTPEARFLQHKQGYKASRFVRNYGVCLRPQLSKGCGPYSSRAEALEAEAQLAQRLKKQGYCVFGGH